MTLDELKDYLLINSLQHFIGADDIEVTDEVLQGLVKRAVTHYTNWRPHHVQDTIAITEYVTFMKHDSQDRRILNVINLYYYEPILMTEQGAVDWNWDYSKDNGQFRTAVLGNYMFELLVQPTLADLDDTHPEFMDMIMGLYMMYVGSSRKSFTFGDQPFENDGAELYGDGKELWETTLESLKTEQDSWYLSIL